MNSNQLLPFYSGFFGSLASIIGKYIFLESEQWPIPPNIIFRVIAFLLTLYVNKWMLFFQFKSLQINGATLTTVISFVSNTVLSILAGLCFYGESFAIMKMVGLLFVWNGIYLLEKSKHKKE